jgi:hypothetical protein
LPVIAHGDTLTDARLDRVRKAVRRDLARAGVDMGVFGIGEEEAPERGRKESRVGTGKNQADDDSDEEPKVIKIRSTRRPSRARPGEHDVPVPEMPKGVGLDNSSPVSPANGSTSDVHFIPKVDDSTLARMFPLVVIAPDIPKPKRGAKPKTTSPTNAVSASPEMPGTPTAITTDDPDLPSAELAAGFGARAEATSKVTSPAGRSPSAYPSSASALPPSSWRPGPGFVSGGGAGAGSSGSSTGSSGGGGRSYPRGAFTRKYRWGTIDVLDPAHCDVGVLRGVVLGSHMKVRFCGGEGLEHD